MYHIFCCSNVVAVKSCWQELLVVVRSLPGNIPLFSVLSQCSCLVSLSLSPTFSLFFLSGPREALRGGQHTATYYTPNKPHSSYQMNTSHISPFNPNLLLAMGHRPSPSRDEREELFGETSLGMLSEVAQYHGELSGADPNSTTETTMHERFANIRLLSVGGELHVVCEVMVQCVKKSL